MDNVQNCDSYINIPSSQTCKSWKPFIFISVGPDDRDLDDFWTLIFSSSLTRPIVRESFSTFIHHKIFKSYLLTEVFRGFIQSLLENSGIIFRVSQTVYLEALFTS
jgi:hypothetical protein